MVDMKRHIGLQADCLYGKAHCLGNQTVRFFCEHGQTLFSFNPPYNI